MAAALAPIFVHLNDFGTDEENFDPVVILLL